MDETSLQQVGDFFRRRVSIVRRFAVQFLDHATQPVGDLWIDLANWPRLVVRDASQDSVGTFGSKRNASGAGGVEDAAQAEQVAAVVDGVAASLFGRHVLRRAGDDSRSSDRRIINGSGKTEVCNDQPLDTVAQENIGWFDVTMDEPLLMGGGESRSNLSADSQNLDDRQRTSFIDSLLKRLAPRIRHNQIRQPV